MMIAQAVLAVLGLIALFVVPALRPKPRPAVSSAVAGDAADRSRLCVSDGGRGRAQVALASDRQDVTLGPRQHSEHPRC